MSKARVPYYSSDIATSPTKGILQKSHDDCETHQLPVPKFKLRWDENKLKITEKQKDKAFMKIDEPNTPFIKYDPVKDKVINWEVLPDNLRATACEEPEEFSLDNECSSNSRKESISFGGSEEPDEWKQIDEKENKDKEEIARKRHQEFEKKRAQHYSHVGDVLHYNIDDLEDD
ncbi:uncharacterized protein BX663DRAFT_315957 [Cokeromyces recurvatus]|uniref:uncharacterized protein n=1 Tax=Cokeromyces recurvatus TaxID=90255 RepID=UPI002220D642|nr:uncharacterized protein BX663DRAFT_315957 [Cokeromyces recurvatus]KAI7905268.1 hypothetical protein BX663DRAFT_315957 [Cokeromyces recurvatus]